MGDPTYSYQLKLRKKDDEIWKGHYYLYLNKVHDGKGSSRYLGQVDSGDERVKLILAKKEDDARLKELAHSDSTYFFH